MNLRAPRFGLISGPCTPLAILPPKTPCHSALPLAASSRPEAAKLFGRLSLPGVAAAGWALGFGVALLMMI